MYVRRQREPLDPATGTPGGLPTEYALPTGYVGGELVVQGGCLCLKGGEFVYGGELRPEVRQLEAFDAELTSSRARCPSGCTAAMADVDRLLIEHHGMTDSCDLEFWRFLLRERDAGRLEARAELDRKRRKEMERP